MRWTRDGHPSGKSWIIEGIYSFSIIGPPFPSTTGMVWGTTSRTRTKQSGRKTNGNNKPNVL